MDISLQGAGGCSEGFLILQVVTGKGRRWQKELIQEEKRKEHEQK